MNPNYPDFVVDKGILNAKAPYLIEWDFANWRKLNRALAKSSSEPELTSYYLKTLSRLGFTSSSRSGLMPIRRLGLFFSIPFLDYKESLTYDLIEWLIKYVYTKLKIRYSLQ